MFWTAGKVRETKERMSKHRVFCKVVLAWFTLGGATTLLNAAPTPLKALLRPEALTVSCLLVPAASIRKSVNETVPLPAAVPMSSVVVPCNGPVPLDRLRFTFRLAGKPVAV